MNTPVVNKLWQQVNFVKCRVSNVDYNVVYLFRKHLINVITVYSNLEQVDGKTPVTVAHSGVLFQ